MFKRFISREMKTTTTDSWEYPVYSPEWFADFYAECSSEQGLANYRNIDDISRYASFMGFDQALEVKAQLFSEHGFSFNQELTRGKLSSA